MSKYYKPKIEEFHKGFRCEQLVISRTDSEHGRNQEWKKVVATANQKGWLSNYRVKHLDRDDLKELLWERVSDEKDYDFKNVFMWKGSGTQGTLIINHETSDGFVQNITIFEPMQGNRVFSGTCKNYNELLRVMKQTGFKITK